MIEKDVIFLCNEKRAVKNILHFFFMLPDFEKMFIKIESQFFSDFFFLIFRKHLCLFNAYVFIWAESSNIHINTILNGNLHIYKSLSSLIHKQHRSSSIVPRTMKVRKHFLYIAWAPTKKEFLKITHEEI